MNENKERVWGVMRELPNKMKCTLDKAFLPESCPNWLMSSECAYVGACKFKKPERKPASQRVRELLKYYPEHRLNKAINDLANELEQEEKEQ